MFASMLPGLRELRAPLAAGYLWLAAAWLAFGESIPEPRKVHPGALKDFYVGIGAMGKPAIAAAVSFAAYLAGVLSLLATSAWLPMVGLLRRRKGPAHLSWRGNALIPSPAGRLTLHDAVLDELVERCDRDEYLVEKLAEARVLIAEPRGVKDPDTRRVLLEIRIDVDAYARNLEHDLPLLPLRLLSEEKEHEIYGEFDRKRAETEFRTAVVLPLAVLAVVLAFRMSPLLLFALIVPVLLLLSARRSAAAGTDVLTEAVRARAPQLPALTQVRARPLLFRERQDWLRRAGDAGYVKAMVDLARSADERGESAEAERWYRKAANEEDAQAMTRLAEILQQREDTVEAQHWYDRAADAGDPHAMTRRAGMLMQRGDEAEAQRWYDRAADAGDPYAMTRRADMLMQRGDEAEAERWYQTAADAGHVPAIAHLADLLRRRGMTAAADHLLRQAAAAERAPDAAT